MLALNCIRQLKQSFGHSKLYNARAGLLSLKDSLQNESKHWSHTLSKICPTQRHCLQNFGRFTFTRNYSEKKKQVSIAEKKREFKIVIIGAGSGGATMAGKLKNLRDLVAVVEPSERHYYQPIWTLVGGGLKGFQSSVLPTKEVLPNSCVWIHSKAVQFEPEINSVTLESGEKIEYNYLIVAMGLQNDFQKIPGLLDALENDSNVVSNYSPLYVTKTFPAIQKFKGGNAIFTLPNSPIKCPAAPQEIMYLAEEFFHNSDVRGNSEVIFNTALEEIFSVKKYANVLEAVIQERNIEVNYKHNLVEVDHTQKRAVFEKLGEENQKVDFQYNLLHVTPPMCTPEVLRSSTLVNEDGFVDLNKKTLQHNKYANIFGIGDCTNLSNSKTATAIVCQSRVLHKNLLTIMQSGKPKKSYDGYTTCSLITSKSMGILAEFNNNLQPTNTPMIDQGEEREIGYALKAIVMPKIYWKKMIKGDYSGPGTLLEVQKEMNKNELMWGTLSLFTIITSSVIVFLIFIEEMGNKGK